jgi:tetratricopeptide (TPR) repeat protein
MAGNPRRSGQVLDPLSAHLVAPGGSEVAQSESSLGSVESDRGDLEKAEKWHREALAIRQELGPNTLDVATSLNSLGIVEARRGNLDRAEDFWRQSLAIKEKLVPESLEPSALIPPSGRFSPSF